MLTPTTPPPTMTVSTESVHCFVSPVDKLHQKKRNGESRVTIPSSLLTLQVWHLLFSHDDEGNDDDDMIMMERSLSYMYVDLATKTCLSVRLCVCLYVFLCVCACVSFEESQGHAVRYIFVYRPRFSRKSLMKTSIFCKVGLQLFQRMSPAKLVNCFSILSAGISPATSTMFKSFRTRFACLTF